MLLSTKSIGSLTNPPAAAPMFAARDPLGSVPLRLHINSAPVEQAALAPSNIVPGIGHSPDKMLQARIFSYADAHRYRVGVNADQLAVNRPRAVANTSDADGAMRLSAHANPNAY